MTYKIEYRLVWLLNLTDFSLFLRSPSFKAYSGLVLTYPFLNIIHVVIVVMFDSMNKFFLVPEAPRLSL